MVAENAPARTFASFLARSFLCQFSFKSLSHAVNPASQLQRGSRNESDCNVYGFIVFIGDLFWGSVMILGGLGVFVYARLLEGQ